MIPRGKTIIDRANPESPQDFPGSPFHGKYKFTEW
nr:MAG TPA: hypothetical protein [Caudoviricetes sp.]